LSGWGNMCLCDGGENRVTVEIDMSKDGQSIV
jgi:hypothetical protein